MLALSKRNGSCLPSVRSIIDDFFNSDQLFDNIRSSSVYCTSENKDSYNFSLDVPGFSKDDLEINLDKSVIHILGEKENRMISFQFYLPEGADTEKIKATTKDGVLTIEISKLEKMLPKKISVS
jgi:HSP20 family protein